MQIKKNNPILLILKTPPPYGGGEKLSLALRNHVRNDSDFIAQEISSSKRDKTNQGSFAPWKIKEFILNIVIFTHLVTQQKPILVFGSLSKDLYGFVKDSVFLWIAKIFKTPFAGELHGASFYFLGGGTLATCYGKLVLSRLSCLRVLGKSVGQNLKSFEITNTIIIENGIKCNIVPTYLERKEEDCIRLLFVGTLSPQKGFDQLIKACIILRNKNLNFEVHTMGEWIANKFKEDIKKIIVDNNLEEKIEFHGLVHSQEKWSIFSKSHILVLPSMREGQPLVVLEALACGMPIVTSMVGAIPDTIEDGVNGFLLSVGDVHELARKLEMLINDPRLRKQMSQANTELYQKRFTQERFLRTHVAWLKACASRQLVPRGQYFTIN